MTDQLSPLIRLAGPPWKRTLYILVVTQLMTAAGFSIVIPFLPLYIQELGTNTRLNIEVLSGMAYSAQALTMMVAAPFWGTLADRFGRKLMVQRALLGGAVILFSMGFARSGEELVLLRAVQGLLTGSLSAANALVASTVPRDRTGYAMSTLQVGHWAGLSLGPLLGGFVADTFGFRSAFTITALLILFATVLVRFGVVENFVAVAVHLQTDTQIFRIWLSIFRTPGARPTYMLRFLSNLGRTMLVPILPLFIVSLLLDDARANTITGLAIGLGSAASTMTALRLGRLGDRIGHRQVLQASAALAGLLYIAQSLVNNAWQLLVLTVLTGAVAGGIAPAISSLLAIYGEPGKEGSVYGLDNSITAASRAVSPLVGAGIGALLGFRSTLIFSGIIFLIVGAAAYRQLPRAAQTLQSDPGWPTLN